MNGSSIELDEPSEGLWIDNDRDGAEVRISSVLCGSLMVANVIGSADPAYSGQSIVAIGAEHFALRGLSIVSKVVGGERFNDLGGDVTLSEQKTPMDHTTDEDIDLVRITTDGNISIDGSLSLPAGVPLIIDDRNNGNHLVIGGDLVTHAYRMTFERYTDASGTDTEQVTGLLSGSVYANNGRVDISGQFTAYGQSMGLKNIDAYYAYYYDSDGSCSVYTTLGGAIAGCASLGKDAVVWLHGVTSVADDLRIPEKIALNVVDGLIIEEGWTLTIDGALSLYLKGASLTLEKASAGSGADAGIVLNGCLSSAVGEDDLLPNILLGTERYVIPGAYVSAVVDAVKTVSVYTLQDAIGFIGTAAEITVRGSNTVEGSLEIPVGVFLSLDSGAEISVGSSASKDAVLLVRSGASVKGGTVTVHGTMVVEDSGDIDIGSIVSDASLTNGRAVTYADLLVLLGEARSGDTVAVLGSGGTVISDSASVEEGVVLDVPKNRTLRIAKGATLTVRGTVDATAAGSVIASDGVIDVQEGIVRAIGRIGGGINAAMYETTEGASMIYNYASPETAAGSATGDIVYNGTVSITEDIIADDLKFTGEPGAVIIIDADIEAGLITLKDIVLEVSVGRSVESRITDGGGTVKISGTIVGGLSVASVGGMLTISGSLADGSECSITGIAAVGDADLRTVTVEGHLTVVGSSSISELSIIGTVSISEGAYLEVVTMHVLGTLHSSGTATAAIIYVGFPDEGPAGVRSAVAGADASVSGSVSATGYWVVSEGSDVSGVDLSGYGSTAYSVEGIAYATVYAGAPTPIGVISIEVEDAEWNGWYAGSDRSRDVSGMNVGDPGLEEVHAIIDRDIYTIAVIADRAISQVYLDGERMTRTGDGFISGPLACGSHSISYDLREGYSGTGVLDVRSDGSGRIVVDGTGIEISGGQERLRHRPLRILLGRSAGGTESPHAFLARAGPRRHHDLGQGMEARGRPPDRSDGGLRRRSRRGGPHAEAPIAASTCSALKGALNGPPPFETVCLVFCAS